jgi:hypothetical protein
MAIYRLLATSALGPDEIKRMTEAYELSLRELGITDRSEPITETIAIKIIALAQMGEDDPLVLANRAIAALNLVPKP